MSSVIDEVRAVIPPGARLSGRGFHNFNCPACGDRRGRGGIAFTPSGGFRYRCFNGGCEFEKPTGWEPGNGFGGRPRKIFEFLGGDVRRIPLKELLSWHRHIYDHKGEIIGETQELEVVYKFPSVELPPGTQLLFEAAKTEKPANKVFKYVAQRDPANIRNFPYLWAPNEFSYYYIIPFMHYHEQIVGYVGRHVHLRSGERRFIGKAPTDYMFNQHLISTIKSRYLFVVESPMDAIALNCMAVRGSRMTKKQINLLRVSGKDIVLIPDIRKGEWIPFFETAMEQRWLISCPDFGGGETDVMKSVSKNGLLLTTQKVMEGVMSNYEQAMLKIKMREAE